MRCGARAGCRERLPGKRCTGPFPELHAAGAGPHRPDPGVDPPCSAEKALQLANVDLELRAGSAENASAAQQTAASRSFTERCAVLQKATAEAMASFQARLEDAYAQGGLGLAAGEASVLHARTLVWLEAAQGMPRPVWDVARRAAAAGRAAARQRRPAPSPACFPVSRPSADVAGLLSRFQSDSAALHRSLSQVKILDAPLGTWGLGSRRRRPSRSDKTSRPSPTPFPPRRWRKPSRVSRTRRLTKPPSSPECRHAVGRKCALLHASKRSDLGATGC